MVDYAEAYQINGHSYGIEDYKKPGDHFMPDRPHKRFALWHGGCGIGGSEDLDEARKLLYEHALSQVRAEYHGHQERMAAANRAMEKLGNDPFNLGRFRT
jgi:hypothetical protein